MKKINASFTIPVFLRGAKESPEHESTWRVDVVGTPGTPGRHGGPPERWEEPEGPEVDKISRITNVLTRETIDAETFVACYAVTEEQLDKLGRDAIEAAHGDNLVAAYESTR